MARHVLWFIFFGGGGGGCPCRCTESGRICAGRSRDVIHLRCSSGIYISDTTSAAPGVASAMHSRQKVGFAFRGSGRAERTGKGGLDLGERENAVCAATENFGRRRWE